MRTLPIIIDVSGQLESGFMAVNPSTGYFRATGRPLAEPPIFDYEEWVERHKIPSDARLRRLFDKDIAVGYRYRDALTEKDLLWTHYFWARGLDEQEVNEERRVFYQGLRKELATDLGEVGDPSFILERAKEAGVISELGMWEYDFLDDDGGTTDLQRKLNEGSSEIIDSLRQGHVSYVINTIDVNQHNTRLDGYEIRRTAVENNVTVFTALETVRVLLDVLEEITLRVSTIDAK